MFLQLKILKFKENGRIRSGGQGIQKEGGKEEGRDEGEED